MVKNLTAKKPNEVYKAIFVPNRKEGETTLDEIFLEVGSHAECNAALQQHEANALKGKGKFLLKDGHFALLIADERLLAKKAEIRAALNPEPAKSEPAKPQAEKTKKAESTDKDPLAGE